MKKIIITGGAGFIGSNIVKALNEKGKTNIIIVDHLTNNHKWKNLIDLRFSDYFDREAFLEKIKNHEIENIETIIHIGACSSTTETDENFLLYNNTIYSKLLFDYCTEKNVRFIYASSGATYGNGSKGYNDNETTLQPLNCYGYSKYLFDQWVLTSEKKPPQWVGLKFFNVYGPNEYHKGQMASVIFHSYLQIQEHGEVKLFKSYKKEYKDGEQKRDFVYVKDVVQIILFFLEHENKQGIFNVGTGKARTFLDLTNAVFKSLNKDSHITFIDMPEELKEKYQYFTTADMTKLREIGYDKPFFELEDGIEDYVKKYLIPNFS